MVAARVLASSFALRRACSSIAALAIAVSSRALLGRRRCWKYPEVPGLGDPQRRRDLCASLAKRPGSSEDGDAAAARAPQRREAVLRELALFEFQLARVAAIDAACASETAAHAALRADVDAEVAEARREIARFEVGQPENKLIAAVDWSRGPFAGFVRATRFGDTIDPGSAADGSGDEELSPKTIVDAEFSADITEGLNLAFGANNVFDEYPDVTAKTPSLDGTFSRIFPFSGFSPFGFSPLTRPLASGLLLFGFLLLAPRWPFPGVLLLRLPLLALRPYL